jgi:hypothetical protein
MHAAELSGVWHYRKDLRRESQGISALPHLDSYLQQTTKNK